MNCTDAVLSTVHPKLLFSPLPIHSLTHVHPPMGVRVGLGWVRAGLGLGLGLGSPHEEAFEVKYPAQGHNNTTTWKE